MLLFTVALRWSLWPNSGLLWPHGSGSVQAHPQHCGEPEWKAWRPAAVLPEQGWRGRRRVGQTGTHTSSSFCRRVNTLNKQSYIILFVLDNSFPHSAVQFLSMLTRWCVCWVWKNDWAMLLLINLALKHWLLSGYFLCHKGGSLNCLGHHSNLFWTHNLFWSMV